MRAKRYAGFGVTLGSIKPTVRGVGAAGAAAVVTILVAGTLLAAVIAPETKLTAS